MGFFDFLFSWETVFYTIPEIVLDSTPEVKDIGIDIFTGPRGSLAGSLPSWIAWWSPGHRYDVGNIVYFPGIFEKNIYRGTADGQYGEIHYIDGDVFKTNRTAGVSKMRDRSGPGSGQVNVRRSELGINESLKTSRYRNPYHGGPAEDDVTYAGSSRQGLQNNLHAAGGGLAYFEYGAHTLFVKLFGANDNPEMNDSEFVDDVDFFNTETRRKNGWYSFYELTQEYDPTRTGNKTLKIGFPPENASSSNWNSGDGGYWDSNDAANPYDTVVGSWVQNLNFREESLRSRLASSQTTQNVDVRADEICLNLCDKFVIYALLQQEKIEADYVNFVFCPSVLRSPEFAQNDDNDISPTGKVREIQLMPTDKVTVGGNILRSPKKVKSEDMINPADSVGGNTTALESLRLALTDDQDANEGITVISAGYPAIVQPSAIYKNVKFDPNVSDPLIINNAMTEQEFSNDSYEVLGTDSWTLKNEYQNSGLPSEVQSSHFETRDQQTGLVTNVDFELRSKYYPTLLGEHNALATSNFNIDGSEKRESSILTKNVPLFDPRYGEARTSLNSFLTSLSNFSRPASSSSSIPSWQAETSYKAGEVVRMAANSEDYQLPEEDRKFKDYLWTCIASHKSGQVTSSGGNYAPPSDAPPFLKNGNSDSIDRISEMQNPYWRTYCIMANNPNSSLSSLKGLYSNAGVTPSEVINLTESSNQLTFYRNNNGDILTTTSDAASILQQKTRIRMSDLIGGTRLYASLTVCPAKQYKRTEYQTTTRGRFLGFLGSKRGDTIYTWFTHSPLTEDLAQADLWLYSSSFRKDHSGDIKFAVTFAEETNFVWATTYRKKKSFWGLLTFLGFALIGCLNPGLWLSCAAYGTAAGLGGTVGLSIASGLAGAAIGAPLGVAADALFPAISGKNTKKKMFTRTSFNQMVTQLKGNNKISILRADPESIVRVDEKLTSDGDVFEEHNNEGYESQPDIIRYSFNALYPYIYYNQDGHTNFVEGQYRFYIQDLNSAAITTSKFDYQEIFNRPSRSTVDDLGNTFSGYEGSDSPAPINGRGDTVLTKDNDASYKVESAGVSGSWFGTADRDLWNQYQTLKENVVSKDGQNQVTSTGSIELISTQNYFHYLILGGETFNNPEDPLEALNIWSVDLPESQFKSIIGLMQSGFRDLRLDDLAKIEGGVKKIDIAENWEGLPSEYSDFMTGNLPYLADFEANPGYELIYHETEGACSLPTNNTKQTCEDAGGVWTPRVKGIKKLAADGNPEVTAILPIVPGDLEGLNSDQIHALHRGLKHGKFQLGKHLMDHHSEFVSNLKNENLYLNTEEGGIKDLSSLSDDEEIQGGSVVKSGDDYYFVRKTHKKGEGQLPS